MSDAFQDRENTFEKQFAHDEDLRFKAVARRNKAVALWIAEMKGLSGTDAEKYASEFVGASAAAEQAHERAERRRTSRLRRLVASLAVLVVAVAALAGYAFSQRQDATTARDNANSREIAVEAGQVRGQDAPLAADLSVAAYDTAHTPQATASLLESSGSASAARMLDSALPDQALTKPRYNRWRTISV